MIKSESMELEGQALNDYLNGETNNIIHIHRDDGQVRDLPVSHFFDSRLFIGMITKAFDSCRGKILDVGAGAGPHSLELQKKGLDVLAIDIDLLACEVIKKRGIKNVCCIDYFNLKGRKFDTILLLGRTIGMVADLSGLKHFLNFSKNLLNKNGQIILNSLDVTYSKEKADIAYIEANKKSDRYIGESVSRFEYKGLMGETFKWLYVDPKTLQEYANNQNYNCEIIDQEPDGNYLARLTNLS